MVNTVDRYLARWFSSYALLVVKYWYIFLLVPIVICGVLCSGFRFLPLRRKGKYESVEYVFTPNNGENFHEKAVIAQYWPLDPHSYLPGKSADVERWVEVLIVSKNRSDMMSDERAMNEAFEFGDFVLKNLTVTGAKDYKLKYSDLCLKWDGDCFTNIHLALLKERNSVQKFFALTYPIANRDVAPVYIANLIGGVKINPENGSIVSLQAVRMLFALLQQPQFIDELSQKWTLALQRLVETYRGDFIDVAIFHANSLANGLEENAAALVPKFSITIMLLVSFAVLCSHTTMKTRRIPFPVIDWHKSRPLLAIGGVVSAGLGIAAGMGFLLLIGTPFNPICAVMPFLVISIGIDDMFIVMSTWRETSHHDSVRKRISKAMSDAGVSITITTATDVLSFGIGTFTNFPGVQLFCIYTGVALWFTYLMQMTLFTALMVLSGRREERGMHCLLMGPVVNPDTNFDASLWKLVFAAGSFTEKASLPSPITDSKLAEEVVERPTCFATSYVPVLLHPFGKLVVFIIGILYLVFGIWGCTQMQEGLEPKNLILKSHHAVKWYDSAEQLFFPEGLECQVVVSAAPSNLSSWIVRQDLEQVVEAFEDTKYTMSSNATMFWLRFYLQYLNNIGYNTSDPLEIADEEVWSERLRYWVDRASGTPFWKLDLKFAEDNTNRVEAFRFSIGLRNFIMPNDHRDAAALLRKIASQFPQYNITTWHPYWPFADQYMQIKSNTFQDIGIGVACMVVISALLIPNILTGALIVLSIVTIDIGVVGFMTWWDVNLDVISMITLIMSIGFAVDQTAHVSYGYISSSGSAKQRTVKALNSLGWPMFQGSLSAILGVLALIFVNAYTVVTFFKTVLLAMTFGCAHGLVFLPVLLATVVGDAGGPFPCVLTKKSVKISDININNGSAHAVVIKPDVINSISRHCERLPPDGSPGTIKEETT